MLEAEKQAAQECKAVSEKKMSNGEEVSDGEEEGGNREVRRWEKRERRRQRHPSRRW